MTDQPQEPRQPRQRAYGPDRLYRSPMEDLPPVVQQWRRYTTRLMTLRRRLNRDPLNAKASDWREEGERILKHQQEMFPYVRKAGFNVHPRKGVIPEESLHAKRLRESFENQFIFDLTSSFEGWEAFSDGADEHAASLPFFKHRDPAEASKPAS